MAEITVPDFGETITEGTIIHWFKEVGDEVATGEPLFEISTDKVDTEVPSPIDGVIIGHATLPVVNQGDALFHIAEVGALDHVGENAHSIVEAMAVSDPPFPASPILDEDELL